MKVNNHLITLLVLLLAGFVTGSLVTRSCVRSDDTPGTITVTDTTYITRIVPGDSVLVTYIREVPVPYYIDTVIYIYRDIEIDTPAIVQEFFRMKYYIDTVYEPDNFMAVIKDSVNFNHILYRQFELQNLRETNIHTTQIVHSELKVPRFGIGINGMFNPKQYFIGPSVSYRFNRYHHWHLGLMLSPNYPASFTLSYHNLSRRNK